ncbi:MAG: hypothetical protein LBV72_10100 [Tannerella sp.]|jgi:hypothetical protein|nr:hypothetical protein [Tannerella sp.]
MKAEQFFREVEKMRSLQKEYFKTRSNIVLYTSKKQEKLIDDEIDRVNRILNNKLTKLD